VNSYLFAKVIAQQKRMPVHKAQKFLIRTKGEGCEHLFDTLLEHLARTITDAIAEAIRFKPLDEIQLLGGATVYRFVSDAIKRVANQTVRRDFNANEALALGAAATIMIDQGPTPYLPTALRRAPPYNYNVTCGDSSVVYCVKGVTCNTSLLFQNQSAICDEVSIVADAASVPEGINPEIIRYGYISPPNIFSDGDFSGEFRASPPDAVLTDARWCAAGACRDTKLTPLRPTAAADKASFAFLDSFYKQAGNPQKRVAIAALFAKLNAVAARYRSGNVEATYPVTDEMRETLTEIGKVVGTNEFEAVSASQLTEMLAKLESMAKSLHIEA
jgi:hypothetical protein